jgi:putative Mn2+ efflux pump MntP
MQVPVATTVSNAEFSKEIIQGFSYETYVENPDRADTDRSGSIDIREAIALAFGLSLNNLSIGLGAGISELDVGATTGLTFLLSVLGIMGGYSLGERFAVRLSGFWAGSIANLSIVATGIYEYFIV